MRVLVGCEFSGRVRSAFRELGHDAWSCDWLRPEDQSLYHFCMDVERAAMSQTWDLAIFFPPCTHLASSGARWFKYKMLLQDGAVAFVERLAALPIEHIAIENPIGVLSTRWRKPDQIVQPWQFGHGEVKATCLWLKNLPLLAPTQIVDGRRPRVHYEPPGPDRWKNRSRTYPGIAVAMATQWGMLHA